MMKARIGLLWTLLAGACFAQERKAVLPEPVRDVRRQIEEMRKAKMPSISIGTRSSCRLVNAAELPDKGTGYRIGSPSRKTCFGTDEMIFGLMELGVEMTLRHGHDGVFFVGDISAKEGGKLAPHLNHQGGRDADLGLYVCSASGAPRANQMLTFDKDGKGEGDVRFDVVRNWTFVCGILESPYFQDLHSIYLADWLKTLLLEHARGRLAGLARNPVERARQEALIKKAEKKVSQPASSPHDNHMHLALACASDDRKEGCRD
ncbi:MAG: penicillin-insensitive murein endopeptidase [Planctomycetes bacterium]|nr:penicillin-insensitive murein endopeptidase [Planctomycetota bacterium]